MGEHPQLRALSVPISDEDAVDFFSRVVPALLRRDPAAARAIGGRYGILARGREWVIDLDHGVVSGDAFSTVVADDDGLDAVITFDDKFVAAGARAKIHAARATDIEPLLVWLETVVA